MISLFSLKWAEFSLIHINVVVLIYVSFPAAGQNETHVKNRNIHKIQYVLRCPFILDTESVAYNKKMPNNQFQSHFGSHFCQLRTFRLIFCFKFEEVVVVSGVKTVNHECRATAVSITVSH